MLLSSFHFNNTHRDYLKYSKGSSPIFEILVKSYSKFLEKYTVSGPVLPSPNRTRTQPLIIKLIKLISVNLL